MAVLISSKVKGQTLEGYEGGLSVVEDQIKSAPGFILQCAHPTEDGWAVMEIWDSRAEADQWFAKHVVPHLPAGIHPKRSYQELYNVLEK